MVTKLWKLSFFLEIQVKLFAALLVVHTDRNKRATTTNKRPRKKKDTSWDEKHFGVSLYIFVQSTQ